MCRFVCDLKYFDVSFPKAVEEKGIDHDLFSTVFQHLFAQKAITTFSSPIKSVHVIYFYLTKVDYCFRIPI